MTDPDFILALPSPFNLIQKVPFAEVQVNSMCPRSEVNKGLFETLLTLFDFCKTNLLVRPVKYLTSACKYVLKAQPRIRST